jgi:hypothetical protein
MIFVYRILLGVPCILAFVFGVGVLSELIFAGPPPLQETVGLLGILIGAVFFTGYVIVESIMSLRKYLPK